MTRERAPWFSKSSTPLEKEDKGNKGLVRVRGECQAETEQNWGHIGY